MIKAILLDLDNTLLINPDRAFAVEYVRLLDGFFEQALHYPLISQHLRQSIQALNGERPAPQTNAAFMLEAMARTTGLEVFRLEKGLAAFHRQRYPLLRSCTSQIAIALPLVEYLQQEGYAVIIASNPIYPETAILQRLEWAGLPANPDDYALVTHSENMHFAKPDPAYYAEILGRVGVEPDEAFLVGDSLRNDIIPAEMVGLYSYYVGSEDFEAAESGTLEGFYTKAQQNDWREQHAPKKLQPTMIEPQLRGNIGALYGLLQGIKDNFWMQHPDPEEWSIMQIVCHLKESEQAVQRPRLQRILNENNPFLADPNPPPGPEHPPCDDDGYRVAGEFVRERMKTLQFLGSLDAEHWHRPARHSVFGPTTLLEMALFTAQHDRLHLDQLCQTLGHCA